MDENVNKARPQKKSGLFYVSRSPMLVTGLIIIGLILVIALFPQLFTAYDPNEIGSAQSLLAPCKEHLFGTDMYGRDIFARVIYATRLDLFIGVGAVSVPFVFGTALGLISGYYGGRIDAFIMRIVDILMSIPYMVLCVLIVAVLSAGVKSLLIAMWLVGWKNYTRLIRSEVMVVKTADYIQAARVLGYSDIRIMFRHILPNVISSALVYMASDIVSCMMAVAGLSFLGIGVQPPTPEWGAIISLGKSKLLQTWWQSLFPGLFLLITGFGFSLIGDGISDIIRTKGR